MELTTGLDRKLLGNVYKTIENNDKESFDVLSSFIQQILHLGVKHSSISHFEKFVFFPSFIYEYSYKESKSNVSLTQIHKYCVEQALEVLKAVSFFHLGIVFKQLKTYEEKQALNKFNYWIFCGFNRFLYYSIRNKDYYHFDKILDKVELLTMERYDYFELKREKLLLEIQQVDSNNSRINEISKLIDEEKILIDYKFQVLLGIKYWIFYLYDKDYLSSEDASTLSARIIIPRVESTELIKTLLFIRSAKAQWHFEWHSWDYKDRQEFKVYSPPVPSKWMTMGFLIDQILSFRLYLNLNELTEIERKETEFLYMDLESMSKNIISNFGKWSELLKITSELDLKAKIDNILSIFAVVKNENDRIKARAIAEAPLSLEKIKVFKEKIGNEWKSQARIHRLFKIFGNNRDVTNLSEDKLLNIGQRTFFEKAKIMFIEGANYSPVYGIEQIGGQIGREEDENFFNSILKLKDYHILVRSDIETLFDNCIGSLNSKKVTPSLILISTGINFYSDEVINNPRFNLGFTPLTVSDTSINSIGTFDNIPIFTSFSKFLNNGILVCDFKTSFEMLYKTNEEWYEREMTIDVREISDLEARKKLEINPEKWANNKDGDTINYEDSLALIKTSVMIDAWITVDFKVQSLDHWIIGFLDNK